MGQRTLTRKKLRKHKKDGDSDFEGKRHAEAEDDGQGDGGEQAVPNAVTLAKKDQGPIGCREGHPQGEAPQTTDRRPAKSVLLNPRDVPFPLAPSFAFLPSLSQPSEEKIWPGNHGGSAKGTVELRKQGEGHPEGT